jgi:hypothetical protein
MKHELLSIVSALIVGSTTFASVSVLNFDDLTVPGDPFDSGRGPLAKYEGFRFSSVGVGSEDGIYTGQWGWYGVNHEQSKTAGYAVGLRGNAALYTPYYRDPYANQNSRWNITRTDGVGWHFFGAWFTSAWDVNQDLRIVGKRNGVTQFDVSFSISDEYQSWLSYGAGYEIDTLSIWREGMNTINGSHFIMDDFYYSLAPAPGCLSLLFGGSLIRSRRRK